MFGGAIKKRRRADTKAPSNKVVLARRADGLGERLNALLNAMRLAEILDVDFRFTWPLGRTARDPNHAIVEAEEFFDADFVAAHKVDHRETATGFELPTGPKDDLAALREQMATADGGLMATTHPLRQRIDPEAVPAITAGFAAEFAQVRFHPRITRVIEQARAVPIEEGAVGIHLRAGDNLFGRFRSWTRFWYKVVPAPIARALIDRFRAEGRDVLLFGEDPELIAELCATTGAIDALSMRPTENSEGESLSPPEVAMFDLVLLSRCERIISGWSGFAIQAASIADRQVENHLELIGPADSITVIRDDMARNADRYAPTHRAVAWWSAYYGAKDKLSDDEAIELVTNALAADPTNPRYRLRLAALNYRAGRTDDGDAALMDALAHDISTGEPTLASVLLFSLITVGGYDSEEIFGDIEAVAAARPGPALLYRAALRAQRGDETAARQDLADFRAHAADAAWATDLGDEVVSATIEHRIKRAGRPG